MSADPYTSGGQNPRPRPPTIEEIILGSLRGAAQKAGAELNGLVVPHRIAEAQELVVRREAKAIVEKATNYAKGIAADKKFRGHHLLRELGVKLPASGDVSGNTADKTKSRRKAAEEKSEQGNAGEAAQ